MRRRSSLVCEGLARTCSGAASARTALSRHCCSCCAYTPFSRHQALREASSIAAVVITASRRAAAVHTRSFAGLANDSARQRSSVSTPTPISRDTTCGAALSGGSMRATARSLNACPYRANFFSHPRPRVDETMVCGGRRLRRRTGCAFVGDALRAPASLPWTTHPRCPPRRPSPTSSTASHHHQ